MTKCYYPGCEEHASTKEHIPPKSFFPSSNKKDNLMTVKSCPLHNNEKSHIDIYVLANICLNSILDEGDSNAKNAFLKSVKPKLENEYSFKRILLKDTVKVENGYEFKVDIEKFNHFFNCLTYGVLFKKSKKIINKDHYKIKHIYPNLKIRHQDDEASDFYKKMLSLWDFFLEKGSYSDYIKFDYKDRKGYSIDIYDVKIMGADSILNRNNNIDGFTSSLTLVHCFFGSFKVISLLTRIASFDNTPVYIKRTIDE